MINSWCVNFEWQSQKFKIVHVQNISLQSVWPEVTFPDGGSKVMLTLVSYKIISLATEMRN